MLSNMDIMLAIKMEYEANGNLPPVAVPLLMAASSLIDPTEEVLRSTPTPLVEDDEPPEYDLTYDSIGPQIVLVMDRTKDPCALSNVGALF